ncbi:MAG: hypothetical protein U0Q22_02975 [Acidimicrobiales bacterium]
MAIIIDVATSTVIHDGTVTELSDREMAVLQALGKGSVVSRADLIRDAGLTDLSARRCESVIMALRRILGADAIVNLRRRGWRLAADVELRA